MQALVYTAPQQIQLQQVPEPQVTADDALVEIHSVGICGSDMHAYLGHDPRRVPPLILGHEAVGSVLDGALKGQRVVINPLITCGKCPECLGGRQNLCAERDLLGMYRAGAFAERVALPVRNLIPLPPDMDASKAALTEPAATALHAIGLAERCCHRPLSESRVWVIGAGSVGLLTALLMQDKGAVSVQIGETNARRRATVEQHTDCAIVDPRDHPPATAHYDVVFDAVGSAQSRQSALDCVKPGGIVVHIGLMDNHGEMDTRKMTLQEITFIGCYTYTPNDLAASLQKLHSGALGSLAWLAERPLQHGAAAFDELMQGQCAAPKVVLTL